MRSKRRTVRAGTRGGLGRLVAMALALAAGLVLALATEARGQGLPIATGLTVVGGDDWRAANDFDLFWTNPADAQIAGVHWRLSQPGFAGAAQFLAAPEISELDHLTVPAAGVWDVLVWLRDSSGFEPEFLAAEARLRLDDVAPLVSFMPGDAQVPSPQLVAATTDTLSGIADGTISYRRLDEQRWTDLPTAIQAGALGTELVAATPELKPGTSYVFRAEAWDHAGNAGETTIRADGAPMQFRAPEAAGEEGAGRGGRGAGGRGASGGPRASGGRGASGAGGEERVRLLVRIAGSRSGRGHLSAAIDAGETALLRGALTDRDGGLEGRRLRVVIRAGRGARAGRRVEPVTTGPGGRFELRLAPGPSRRLAVVFAGDERLRPARRRLALRVRAAVSLRAAPRRLRTGGRLRLEGRVGSRGARVPRAGKLVTISYWEREARRWRPVIVTRTDRAGRFRASYRFRYVSGRARIRLRAEAPAEAQWPYAPGASRPVTVEVRG
ncbi:MAG: hypothetical protein AB7V58_07360 [Solirubrobacterales bacterium]